MLPKMVCWLREGRARAVLITGSILPNPAACQQFGLGLGVNKETNGR